MQTLFLLTTDASATTILKVMGGGETGSSILWGAALCTSHSHYLVLFSFIAEQLQRVGNKALTAALHRPGVRRAQLDKVGQCEEEAHAGGPFQQGIPRAVIPENPSLV